MKPTSLQILLLRLIVGGLFVTLALDKYHEGWLTNPEPLRVSLTEYQQRATGTQLKFLEYVAIPYAGMWAKCIIIGEGCIAISLLLGLLVRLSSAVGIFMLLNFRAANGNLFSWKFFSSPWAGLLFSCLLILLLVRAGRWAGVDALLAKSNSKGVFW